MGHPRSVRAFGGALLWFVCTAAVDARGQMFVPTGRDTLRGLPGVEVVVEPLDTEVERAGLTRAAIQSDVERKLRERGVRVYSTQTENPSPAKPYLYVHVNALKLADTGGFAIAIQVHLRQTVRSVVTPSSVVNAMTWDTHNVVFVTASQLRHVRDEIASYVDMFARDWLATHLDGGGHLAPPRPTLPQTETGAQP